MDLCGSCYWWMKSRSCPREKNVNGWNRGPSMNDPACKEYLSDDAMRRQRLASRFSVLLAGDDGITILIGTHDA